MFIGNDVVSLFQSMKEQRTGAIVGEMVEQTEMEFEGADYKEMARYCAGNHHLCSSLKEVERLLPWRRKRRGRRAAGMQNPEMKGKEMGRQTVWQFSKGTPTRREKDPEGKGSRDWRKDSIQKLYLRDGRRGLHPV